MLGWEGTYLRGWRGVFPSSCRHQSVRRDKNERYTTDRKDWILLKDVSMSIDMKTLVCYQNESWLVSRSFGKKSAQKEMLICVALIIIICIFLLKQWDWRQWRLWWGRWIKKTKPWPSAGGKEAAVERLDSRLEQLTICMCPTRQIGSILDQGTFSSLPDLLHNSIQTSQRHPSLCVLDVSIYLELLLSKITPILLELLLDVSEVLVILLTLIEPWNRLKWQTGNVNIDINGPLRF